MPLSKRALCFIRLQTLDDGAKCVTNISILFSICFTESLADPCSYDCAVCPDEARVVGVLLSGRGRNQPSA